MYTYRKKPVLIEAMQWDGTYECAQQINEWNGMEFWKIEPDGRMKIPTLEGLMIASLGDYIIKGIKGEFYPCRSDIFEETYDKAEETWQE